MNTKAVRSEHRQYLGALSCAELLEYARAKYGDPHMLLSQAEAMCQVELRNLHLTERSVQCRREEQKRKRDLLDQWLRRSLRERAASGAP